MGIFDIFKGKTLLGIDLGSRNIKIVEVEKAGDKLKLLNYIIINLEQGEKLSQILEVSQVFEENLGKILEAGVKEFKTKDVIYVIPSPYVFTTYFSLPYLPLSTLKNAVSYEARKYMPASIEDFIIEWRNNKFTPRLEEATERWFIFFTATPKYFLEKLKNISLIAGLNLKGIETEYFAIENFFKNVPGNRVYIDLGYSYSNLIFIMNGNITYSQKLNINARSIIESISNLLKINLDGAEDYMLKRGFNIPPEEEDVRNVLDGIIDAFSKELSHSCEEINEKFNCRIEHIYLAGGMSLYSGFLDLFSEKFRDVPVSIFDPFQYIIISKKVKNLNLGPILVNAIGSCFKYFFS
ncbi:MAG: pilus assembly protein PilM [Minisyncoccia bacterium]